MLSTHWFCHPGWGNLHGPRRGVFFFFFSPDSAFAAFLLLLLFCFCCFSAFAFLLLLLLLLFCFCCFSASAAFLLFVFLFFCSLLLLFFCFGSCSSFTFCFCFSICLLSNLWIWCAAGWALRPPQPPPCATKSALHLRHPRLPRNQYFKVNSPGHKLLTNHICLLRWFSFSLLFLCSRRTFSDTYTIPMYFASYDRSQIV